MDKMVMVKGLIIRTTPIIPDMKEGMSPFSMSAILGQQENADPSTQSLFPVPSMQSHRHGQH
jgi:hypothetical protein